jgi:DNA-binding NtrC family response regulator
MHWIAVLPPVALEEPAWRQLVRDHCIDYHTTPLDHERLRHTLGHALGMAALRNDAASMRGDDDAMLAGQSAAILRLRRQIVKVASASAPVLIWGESGSGKELAAQAVHAHSPRRKGPFVPINCGAIPAALIQSELFGHERGAFTGAAQRRIGRFEQAHQGTLFLDEVGDLPLEAQTNLLRFLQEGSLERVGSSQPISIDVRVLAATHVDLEKAVAQGSFREDLYYRLNVLRLHMPPLRERGGDVELLAQHFLDHFREQHCSYARGFSSAARRAMRSYAWPGNVRELLNRVQRAAVVAEDALIGPADLDLRTNVGMIHRSLGLARVAAERDAIVACLRESQFNISECARRLSISRVTVYRLCKKHQLQLEDMR